MSETGNLTMLEWELQGGGQLLAKSSYLIPIKGNENLSTEETGKHLP